MNRNRRSIVIDTDTGCDDAVALIMALRSPSVEVKAITTVAGNVTVEQATRNALFTVEQATRNALFTVELCGADVRVFSGAAKPLETRTPDCRMVQRTRWTRRSRLRAIRERRRCRRCGRCSDLSYPGDPWRRTYHPWTTHEPGISPASLARASSIDKPVRRDGWSTLLRR
jgi:hypothetical protein